VVFTLPHFAHEATRLHGVESQWTVGSTNLLFLLLHYDANLFTTLWCCSRALVHSSYPHCGI